jgi:hypothetical protein
MKLNDVGVFAEGNSIDPITSENREASGTELSTHIGFGLAYVAHVMDAASVLRQAL